ncbi:unnamed protein product, partial [Symbiodinium sp. KB8]
MFMLTLYAVGLPTLVQAGGELALVGLGTGGVKQVSTIVKAIRLGYRTIDTALLYGNHGLIRDAIEQSGVARDEFFLTSKVGFFPTSLDLPEEHQKAFGFQSLPVPAALAPGFHPLNRKGKELEAIRLSLEQLGVSYLDLCLIHTPVTSALELAASFIPHAYGLWAEFPKWSEVLVKGALAALASQEAQQRVGEAYEQRKRSWQNLEEAKRRGLCKHIGVSNYPIAFMKEMEAYRTFPIYNEQQELHPLAQFRHIQDYASKAQIRLTGYGTGVIASNAVAREISTRLGRSPGQVLLRWAVQKGIAVTPKSNKESRLRENLEVLDFVLEEEDMKLLDALDKEQVFYWNTSLLVPDVAPVAVPAFNVAKKKAGGKIAAGATEGFAYIADRLSKGLRERPWLKETAEEVSLQFVREATDVVGELLQSRPRQRRELMDGLADLRPPRQRESPDRTWRRRMHQALQNLCRFLLDSPERLEGLSKSASDSGGTGVRLRRFVTKAIAEKRRLRQLSRRFGQLHEEVLRSSKDGRPSEELASAYRDAALENMRKRWNVAFHEWCAEARALTELGVRKEEDARKQWEQ